MKQRRYGLILSQTNPEVKRFPRSTELFNKAYNHISERIDQVYKDLTKGKAAPMGGVAYLSLEDNEVRTGRCQWHVDARLYTHFFSFSGAVRGRYQVSCHASYETISRHGTAVWWRKNGGGTSPIICNPQVQNFEFDLGEPFFVSDAQPCVVYVVINPARSSFWTRSMQRWTIRTWRRWPTISGQTRRRSFSLSSSVSRVHCTSAGTPSSVFIATRIGTALARSP